MRTYLAAVVALSLSWNAWSRTQASDHYGTPLPGALGRFFGVGYGAGYHARRPCRPSWEQRMHYFAAPVDPRGPVHISPDAATINAQTTCPQCSTAAPQVLAPQVLAPYASLDVPAQEAQRSLRLQPHADPVPAGGAPSQATEQPLPQQSPSDRGSFLKRLPNLRGAANVSDLPAPPAPPKRGSVARSSILQIEAR